MTARTWLRILGPVALVGASIIQTAPAAYADGSDGCVASAQLLPSTVLVLTQEETVREVPLTTSCPLQSASVQLLSPSDAPADFILWEQQQATTGNLAEWDEYAFNYTAGETYRTDQSSSGTYVDPNYDSYQVTITTIPFLVLNGSSVTLKVTRSGKKVSITGTTHQWENSAGYGTGAMVDHPESNVLEQERGARWVVVAAGMSGQAGQISETIRATEPHAYRDVIVPTSTVAGSLSPAVAR